MKVREDFPQWICDGQRKMKLQLSHNVGNRLDDCRAGFQKFSKKLNEFPDEIEVFEILTLSPEDLIPDFHHSIGALNNVCKSVIGSWYFRHVCKLRGYLCGLENSMETGNWLVACTCTRNILEDVAHFDFYLRRIDERLKKLIQLHKNEKKNCWKGLDPAKNWLDQYLRCQFEIIAYAKKSIQGSKYDWASYFKKIADAERMSLKELKLHVTNDDQRTHVTTCIKEAQSRHPFPFYEHYKDLSERCHPNFGSNGLVIHRRKNRTKKYNTVVFSDRVKWYDGACAFLEVACEPIISTFHLGSSNIVKAEEVYSKFTEMAEKSSYSLIDFLKKINR